MYFYLLINKDFIIIIQIVRVEFLHTRTELNNENKVILLTSCDFFTTLLADFVKDYEINGNIFYFTL